MSLTVQERKCYLKMLTLTDETRLAFTQRMGDLTAPVRSAFIEAVDQTKISKRLSADSDR